MMTLRSALPALAMIGILGLACDADLKKLSDAGSGGGGSGGKAGSGGSGGAGGRLDGGGSGGSGGSAGSGGFGGSGGGFGGSGGGFGGSGGGFGGSGGGSSDAGMAKTCSNPLDTTACGSGMECTLDCSGSKGFACFSAGKLGIGETCVYGNDCAAGLTCIKLSAGTAKCVQYCRSSSDCKVGTCTGTILCDGDPPGTVRADYCK